VRGEIRARASAGARRNRRFEIVELVPGSEVLPAQSPLQRQRPPHLPVVVDERRKIALHKVPSNLPSQLVPLVINQDNFFPAGILQKDLNNWGPRVGLAYNATDKTVVRTGFGVYYDNLNLNELQFSRLVPPMYGQYSLQPTRTDLSLNADTLFPDLNAIPQFPAPFSMDPSNRSAYTVQWNGNVQRSLGDQYLFEIAYTGSRSYNEHKRYNINQAQPGTTPIATRVPYPAFQSAILYSSDAGWAHFNGLS